MPTPPPPTPAQQQAQENMRQWMEQHHPGMPIPGPFGGFFELGITVQNLVAAAGAGEFAIAPDTGDAIIKQLTEVQDQVGELRRTALQMAINPQLGGGYAEEVGRFLQDVTANSTGSATEVLTQYAQELEQLRDAVAQSMQNYGDADKASAGHIAASGGHP